jgi:hypothetical protein
MVDMGFPSCRSESLVLCGQTEAANAITVAFGGKSGPFDAGASRLRKNWRAEYSSRRGGALTPTGFAEVVSGNFPIPPYAGPVRSVLLVLLLLLVLLVLLVLLLTAV